MAPKPSKKTEEEELKNLIQKLLDFLKSLFGMGKGGGAGPTRDNVMAGLQNKQQMDFAEQCLANPLARSLGKKMIKDHLNNPAVAAELNRALADPKYASKVQRILKNYPNIRQFMNEAAKDTKCQNAAQKVTSSPQLSVTMKPAAVPQSAAEKQEAARRNAEQQHNAANQLRKSPTPTPTEQNNTPTPVSTRPR